MKQDYEKYIDGFLADSRLVQHKDQIDDLKKCLTDDFVGEYVDLEERDNKCILIGYFLEQDINETQRNGGGHLPQLSLLSCTKASFICIVPTKNRSTVRSFTKLHRKVRSKITMVCPSAKNVEQT